MYNRRRIFSPGEIYSVMQWYWLLGAILPVCTYVVARKWPRSIARYVTVQSCVWNLLTFD
jgi:hypothetical protein